MNGKKENLHQTQQGSVNTISSTFTDMDFILIPNNLCTESAMIDGNNAQYVGVLITK